MKIKAGPFGGWCTFLLLAATAINIVILLFYCKLNFLCNTIFNNNTHFFIFNFSYNAKTKNKQQLHLIN